MDFLICAAAAKNTYWHRGNHAGKKKENRLGPE
jgi:hypothetical protein